MISATLANTISKQHALDRDRDDVVNIMREIEKRVHEAASRGNFSFEYECDGYIRPVNYEVAQMVVGELESLGYKATAEKTEWFSVEFRISWF